MKKAYLFVLLIIGFLFLAPSTYAQYGQVTPSYSIVIDKMVIKPNGTGGNTTDYVDNLSPSDPRFKPSQDVWFQLKVTNNSDQILYNVEVRDYVPSYLNPLEGPGNFDSNTRIISWNAGDFQTNETKTYYLKMQVLNQSNLPADKGLFCVVNRADAHNDNVFDDDSSQLCIEKTVTGVKTTPSAGPEFGLALLLGDVGILTAGLLIRKKGNINN